MNTIIAHKCNCLHVYCRLRNLGFSKPTAKRIGRLWEKVYRIFWHPCGR